MRLGTMELVLILVVAMGVFGPSKLPELGRLAGQAVGSFKKYMNDMEKEWTEPPKQTAEAAVTAQTANTEKEETVL